MADLQRLYEESGLVIVVGQTAAAACADVQAHLAKQETPMPLWSWDAESGLQPIEPEDGGGMPWKAGAHTGKAVRAIDAAREQVVCLLGRRADSLDSKSVALQGSLARQVHEKPESWVVLISQGGNLSPLFAEADLDPSRFTIDLRAKAAGPPKGTPSKPAPTRLKLTDLESLDRFDSAEWTEHLNQLPVGELNEIYGQKLFEEPLARVRQLCKRMRDVFVDKDELIDLMAQCAIAQLPMLLLGPWGTGKSLLVRQFAVGVGIKPEERSINTEDDLVMRMTALAQQRREDPTATTLAEIQNLIYENRSARHFEYLVTRFTTPEELLGPVNVEALLSSAVYLRQTRSLLPRAEIVFLDEVFKANSAILNALLTIMNERLFHNAGVPWSVNMIMLFGASNEPPQEADLGAFYDRFPVRALCDSVSANKLRDLLKAAHSQQMFSLVPKGSSAADVKSVDSTLIDRRLEAECCVNDFRLLRKMCLKGFGGANPDDGKSKTFTDTFLQIYRQLRDEYNLSDRSCADFYRLARARALLDGRDELRKEDCRVLRYAGNTPEALRDLAGVIDSMIS